MQTKSNQGINSLISCNEEYQQEIKNKLQEIDRMLEKIQEQKTFIKSIVVLERESLTLPVPRFSKFQIPYFESDDKISPKTSLYDELYKNYHLFNQYHHSIKILTKYERNKLSKLVANYQKNIELETTILNELDLEFESNVDKSKNESQSDEDNSQVLSKLEYESNDLSHFPFIKAPKNSKLDESQTILQLKLVSGAALMMRNARQIIERYNSIYSTADNRIWTIEEEKKLLESISDYNPNKISWISIVKDHFETKMDYNIRLNYQKLVRFRLENEWIMDNLSLEQYKEYVSYSAYKKKRYFSKPRELCMNAVRDAMKNIDLSNSHWQWSIKEQE
ncbi:MAG: hypothetical protein MHPSP_000328 [Paramarteilia canceri]